MRILHARVHHGLRIPENKSEPHCSELAHRRFGKPVPLPEDYDKILTALMRGAENMRRASNV